MRRHETIRQRRFGRAILASGALAFWSTLALAAAQPGDVDLSPTPPDLTTSVDPNILVTYDDSGSMAWTHMPDNRPYDGGAWTGPWRCANVIDPRITDPNDPRARGMNGTYYNPNVTYAAPIGQDGAILGDADASLTAVWVDGIAVKRPVNPVTVAAAAYNNNPDVNASASDTGRTNIMGDGGSGRPRWQCGTGSIGGSTRSDSNWTGASPMTGSNGNPNGGPYYYRFKSTVPLATDPGTGNFTSAGLTALYTAANWEAVPVPSAQYQNFANWYAYYRARSLMGRTSLSRVFGVLGDNVRVAWQNLGNNSINYGSGNILYTLPANQLITNLNNSTNDPITSKPFRQAFFNWIFASPASNGTPSRSALNRAGAFFKRTNTSDLRDPYWEPGQGGQPGRELACRQNFHMLMTDGLYNQPPVTVTGNGATTFSGQTLPDQNHGGMPEYPTSYTPGSGVSPTTIYKGAAATDSDGGSTYSDIAFSFWANNLRPDFATTFPNVKVPPYFPDRTTGVTGSVVAVDPDHPGATPEVFWNPANDPATWPHLVQFAISLGAFGTLQYSKDIDCTLDEGFGVGNTTLCKLRKGLLAWPRPNGTGNGIAANIDDLWHAAINSRGAFFVAGNPADLIQHLADIINNVLSRHGSSTALSATMSTLTTGTQGYAAGYDTGDYSGFLYKQNLNPDDGTPDPTPVWDAGCLLSGGTWASGICTIPNPLPNVSGNRTIFTANDGGSGRLNFDWSSLSGNEQNALNQDPTSTLKCASPTATTNGCDGNGQRRANWLRGDRTNESTAPLLRRRSSVLGAIINSQPRYVSAPTGGFSDNFPPGSPEAIAAQPNASGVPGAGAYSQFVQSNRGRPPTVYVGANDGTMHAFDAVTGVERWAYVPMTLFGIDNVTGEAAADTAYRRRLAKSTNDATFKNAPTVDNTPVVQDVFMSDNAWHTVLVGSLRYGGRGVFALDITNPASPTLLWERNNTMSGFAHLGYTYAYPNVARLSYNGGKWVVLLASGYFPLPNLTPPDPVSNDTSANQTSLFVIDLQSGSLIREIPTSGATSYGLSTAAAYDLNSDQVDDIAVAGDLTGNLWRFDLSNASSSNWTVNLMFQSYAAGDEGKHPISVMPVGMRDPQAQVPIWVFGTGKFIGLCDRTASSPPSGCGPDSNTAIQAFYGIRDYGTASANYPIRPSQLNSWTIAQNASGVRTLTGPTTPSPSRGWTIPLDPNQTGEHGERDVVTVVPFYSANYAILTTLIPKGDDPCDPGRRGAIMAVDAGTGGPLAASPLGGGGPGGSATNTVIGEVVNSNAIPIAGIPAVVGSQGGPLLLPGLPQFEIPAPPPHRGSWRELLDLL
jgi:type IV pilus assembly protein PilY1